MSKTIPTTPPRRPFRPAYSVTTTTRVPGRTAGAARPDQEEPGGGLPPSQPAS